LFPPIKKSAGAMLRHGPKKQYALSSAYMSRIIFLRVAIGGGIFVPHGGALDMHCGKTEELGGAGCLADGYSNLYTLHYLVAKVVYHLGAGAADAMNGSWPMPAKPKNFTIGLRCQSKCDFTVFKRMQTKIRWH
jgi:hypothetical protein